MLKSVVITLALGVAMAAAESVYTEDSADLMENEARFLYFNSSSTATSLTLLGALILLGVIFYLVYVGGLLSPAASSSYSNYNRNDYYNQYGQYSQYQARSASGGYETNWPNILEMIVLARELYNFEYNDIECQKKLLCDIMREDAIFGTVSDNMKKGFKMVRYLENLGMPDDFRELLDEYMDAANMSESQKGCDAYFNCAFDAKKTMSAFYGNAL